jgi:hypothetical protein
MDPLGGTSKSAGIDDRDETAQQLEIEHPVLLTYIHKSTDIQSMI